MMKSFSEYIKESYNFRLGGSQKKGFNQTKMLGEATEGDWIFIFYTKYYITDAPMIKAYEVREDNGWWTDKRSLRDYIKEEGLEDVSSGFGKYHFVTYDLDEAVDKCNKIFNKNETQLELRNDFKTSKMSIKKFKKEYLQ